MYFVDQTVLDADSTAGDGGAHAFGSSIGDSIDSLGEGSSMYEGSLAESSSGWTLGSGPMRPTNTAGPESSGGARSGGRWADPEDLLRIPEREALAHRLSFEGPIRFDAEGYPVNPRGRTGMQGRGCLGRWGPNHAADAVITRRHPESAARLQVLVRWRPEAECYGLPGGFVKVGEKVGLQVRRVFGVLLVPSESFRVLLESF